MAVITAVVATGCGSSDGDAAPTASNPGRDRSSTTRVRPATGSEEETSGSRLFATQCAGCHGSAGEGSIGPALIGIADRMSRADQLAVVARGRGTMLAFSPALTEEQIAAVVDYIRAELS